MKFLLWIPMDHKLLLCRLFIIAMCSVPSAFELHQMLHGERNKMGPFMWIMYIVVGMEALFTIRHGREVFTEAFPIWVQAIWVILGSAFVYGLLKSSYNYLKSEKHEIK